MTASQIGYVFLGLIVLSIVWFIALYNKLVRGRNEVKNSFSQIDVQLKRRYDLIPNLVETVKGYAQHEQATLEKVIAARGAAMQASGVAARAAAESQLGQALANVLALGEAYPDLKANQNFLKLQEEITTTENRIGYARQNYNDQVLQQNNAIQMFPSNLVATAFGFREEEHFALASEAEAQVPQVKF